jgi:hypothetical protein
MSDIAVSFKELCGSRTENQDTGPGVGVVKGYIAAMALDEVDKVRPQVEPHQQRLSTSPRLES